MESQVVRQDFVPLSSRMLLSLIKYAMYMYMYITMMIKEEKALNLRGNDWSMGGVCRGEREV